MKELFPVYPLILKSLPKTKIKFGTRWLYVDLPWQAYHFMQLIASKSLERDITAGEVKKEWDQFLSQHKDSLTLNGRPFISVYLKSAFGKKFLGLRIKWWLFTECLEEKASSFIKKIEISGEKLMEVYREIWTNFFNVIGEMESPPPTYFPVAREKFRTLLKRTGDYSYIEELLNQFEKLITKINEILGDKNSPVKLYTTNLLMDIRHLRVSVEVANIPTAYLLLRNILESFVKFFVYLKVGKSIDRHLYTVLSSMFIYEYEAVREYGLKKLRRYSLKGFIDEFVRKFSKVAKTISPDMTLQEFISKLKEKQVPTLGINPQFLKEFSKKYNLNEANLDKLYSACSVVIHNQPPLPFFSLLEVKFFKHFLEKYIQSMRILTEKIINEKIKIKTIPTSFLLYRGRTNLQN